MKTAVVALCVLLAVACLAVGSVASPGIGQSAQVLAAPLELAAGGRYHLTDAGGQFILAGSGGRYRLLAPAIQLQGTGNPCCCQGLYLPVIGK